MLDRDFEEIYDAIKQRLLPTTKNEGKAKTYIDACHEPLKMNLGLSVLDNKISVFYLVSDPSRTYDIDLMKAPEFDQRVEFISWAKSEIQKVKTICS
ncbi:hypothetical protein [Acinetobacter rudis]|uniref:hypothetical protein n=1 Tax=Acinetobacter rudis TaxID=632955 RepID=UPI0033429286